MFGIRVIRMRDRHHLDLQELVLADHAARIAARGTRFRAEARRQRGEAQRQLRFIDDLVARPYWSAALPRSE